MSLEKDGDTRVMHWNPTCPASLILPKITSYSGGESRFEMEGLLADRGIGCNVHEVSALIKIVGAHEKYMMRCIENSRKENHFSNNSKNSNNDNQSVNIFPPSSAGKEIREDRSELMDGRQTQKEQICSLRDLSSFYRSSVRDCLADWMSAVEERVIGGHASGHVDGHANNHANDTNDGQDGDSEDNLDLLRVVYSIMHISDIFLPLLPSAKTWGHLPDPYQKRGIASAATVRYLRYHHIDAMVLADSTNLHHSDDALQPNLHQNFDNLKEMMDSAYPEQYNNGIVYWEYLRQLVLCGYLEMAWEVLRKHSLFACAMDAMKAASKSSHSQHGSSHEFSRMAETYQGFLHLKEILFRAPIPGGRNDYIDDAVTYDEKLSFEVSDDIDEAFSFLDGLDVLPGDFKYWEINYASASATWGSSDCDENAMNGFLLHFNEKIAVQKHRQWSEYVKDVRSFFGLSKRIVEIDTILAILSGDFKNIQFQHWAQKICAELLYVYPDARPVQIAKRTRMAVDLYCHRQHQRMTLDDNLDDNNDDYDDDNDFTAAHANAVVSIMDGDASTAIEYFYGLGGATGAALPTTLMSLLYNIYIESNILTDDLASRKTEFLCDAAFAIVSSLADTDPDIGAQLAVRLLMPYSVQRKDIEILATIVNILEHYYPSTDHYADTIISYLSPLLKLKSYAILECCCTIRLCRYRYHKNNKNLILATASILGGIELESQYLSDCKLGLCYRIFASLCDTISLSLLESVVGIKSFSPVYFLQCRDVGIALDHNSSFDISIIFEATHLLRVLYISEHLNNENDDNNNVMNLSLGNCILSCLERKIDADGVYYQRGTSRISQHWLLLQLACQLIEQDIDNNSHPVSGEASTITNTISNHSSFVFDVQGITHLMECLHYLSLNTNNYSSTNPKYSLEHDGKVKKYAEMDVKDMERILAIGLSLAINFENALKKQRETQRMNREHDIDRVVSINLFDDYDISFQEQVVKKMLEY